MDLQGIEPQMSVCVEIYYGVLQRNLNFSTPFFRDGYTVWTPIPWLPLILFLLLMVM